MSRGRVTHGTDFRAEKEEPIVAAAYYLYCGRCYEAKYAPIAFTRELTSIHAQSERE